MTKEQALLEIKNKIKALFNNEVEVKLYSCETADGTKLEVDGDSLMVSAPIYKLDENGNRIALEDGEYTLTDGMMISVAGGVITEISAMEEETPEAIVENPVETAEEPVQMSEVEIVKTELSNRIESLELQLTELISLVNALTDSSTKLGEKMTELSNQPAAETIVYEKALTAEELRIEKFKAIQKGIKK